MHIALSANFFYRIFEKIIFENRFEVDVLCYGIYYYISAYIINLFILDHVELSSFRGSYIGEGGN